MHISQPASITEMYVENDSTENKYKGLLNANFQDYMDAIRQSGQFEVKAAKLKQRISALFTGVGIAGGSLGGPSGIALGTAIGNSIGKYFGNVASNRIYGQAIADMSEIVHDAKLRHAQLAATLAFQNQVGTAIDTMRQNENKRKKDDLQAMQV